MAEAEAGRMDSHAPRGRPPYTEGNDRVFRGERAAAAHGTVSACGLDFERGWLRRGGSAAGTGREAVIEISARGAVSIPCHGPMEPGRCETYAAT